MDIIMDAHSVDKQFQEASASTYVPVLYTLTTPSPCGTD